MKVLGIIAEYNPFHNGHLYHLQKSKESTGADVAVAVMSGNFVQRGEPALLDKWIRSEMAVINGVDLVLELPFVYSCNNAQIFAYGGVKLLDGLGYVDSLCFGSEDGNIEPLMDIATVLADEPTEFSEELLKKMKEGISYPRAREFAIGNFLGKDKAAILKEPNNILGVEYLRQLKLLGSKIVPYTIKRKGAGEKETENITGTAGATAIRYMIDEGKIEDISQYIPFQSETIIKSEESMVSNYEMFCQLIIYAITSKTPEELSEIYSISEGLENRIIEAAKTAKNIREMIGLIKSKRYTETRIKRILIHILMGMNRSKVNSIMEKNLYARVLAFNEKGASLLKDIKKDRRSILPLITNINKEKEQMESNMELFKYDILAADIYNLVVKNNIYDNSDYRKIPAYIT